MSLLSTPPNPDDFYGEPSELRPGTRVRLKRPGPPWFVIEHRFDKVIVPRWPIRLWSVTDVQLAPASEQVLRWSTRAEACTVVVEVEAWRVFGERGALVAAVIEQAERLTEEDASSLAWRRSGQASTVYRVAWQGWRGDEAGLQSYEGSMGPLFSTPTGSPVGVSLMTAPWREHFGLM